MTLGGLQEEEPITQRGTVKFHFCETDVFIRKLSTIRSEREAQAKSRKRAAETTITIPANNSRLMGTAFSCCVGDAPTGRHKQYQADTRAPEYYVNNNAWHRDDSSTCVPHISEREPDEAEDDPSTHPTKGPLFMERSKSDLKLRDNRRSFYVDNYSHSPSDCNGLVKASSCSTIFLDDSTISQPNMKNTIKCISLGIFYHIVNRKNRGRERQMEIFDEKLHPLTKEPVPSDYARYDPDHRHIYRFIRTLFNAAQLTAECAIITLVYLERLLTYAEIDICPANWRRIVLGAILLASKVWDDQAVWNVDYCQILRDTTVEDMNELERQFLECLQFNINVPSSVYAKYYFDLRTLAGANDLQLPLQPLYRERAKKLEALSRICEDKLAEGSARKSRRRWSSMDRFDAPPRNTVILS